MYTHQPDHTLPALLRARAVQTPEAAAFAVEETPGRWRTVNWRAFFDQAQAVSGRLRRAGVRRGTRLAIIAPVGLEWEIVHHAALAAGAAVLGLDAHDQPQRLREMLDQAGVDALAVADPSLLECASPACRARLKAVLHWGAAAPDADTWPMAWTLREWMQPDTASVGGDGKATTDAVDAEGALPSEPGPDDVATIIFTSGTTGHPKGIAYSHAQLCLAIEAIADAFPFVGPGSHLLCWLPLSNLFQRVVNLAGMRRGALSHLLADPRRVMDVVGGVAPDVFVGVPRFYEKLYQGLLQRIGDMPPLQRRALAWAWDVGRATSRGRQPGGRLSAWARGQWWLADRLVLRRVRAIAGPRLRCFVSGSAPAPRRLLEEMHGLGWTVLEAYGLSENVMPMAMNRLDDYRFGSVGRPLPGQRVRCAEDGTLSVEGPGVFTGYLGHAPRPDGPYRTGDEGRFDDDGFLFLTGRSGDLFKTSTGRRVAPAGIEAALATCPGVDQVIVVGAGRPYLAALCVLLPGWWPDRRDELARELAQCLAPLNAHDRPAVVGILRQPFEIVTGELTPNLKLRRRAIEARRAAEIDALYGPARDAAMGANDMPDAPRLVPLN